MQQDDSLADGWSHRRSSRAAAAKLARERASAAVGKGNTAMKGGVLEKKGTVLEQRKQPFLAVLLRWEKKRRCFGTKKAPPFPLCGLT